MMTFLRDIVKTGGLFLLVVVSSLGVWQYYEHFSSSGQILKLQQEKRDLENIVARLTTQRRVAQVLVTDQKTINGVLHTTLLFCEYGAGGSTLSPKRFEIEGNIAHVDAMVIKFDQDFVKQGDSLKGHSICLFTKIYGDHQTPDSAPTIDTPNQIPDIYKDADPKVSAFEQELWRDFWRLTTDEAYAKSKGVRTAMGQAVWDKFTPDKLYTFTLESNGGLNITREPLAGIYREALKHRS
jgi:hypothetical protein